MIGVMGPSCSGKTSVCIRMAEELGAEYVSTDDFFVERGQYPKIGDFENMDSPETVKWDELAAVLSSLKERKTTKVPVYDREMSMVVGTREAYPRHIVVSEGFILFHMPEVRDLLDTRIYLDIGVDTQFSRRCQRGLHSDKMYFDEVVVPMFEMYGRPLLAHAHYTIDAERSLDEVVVDVRNIIRTRGVGLGA